MSISLQQSASTQPRTSPPNFVVRALYLGSQKLECGDALLTAQDWFAGLQEKKVVRNAADGIGWGPSGSNFGEMDIPVTLGSPGSRAPTLARALWHGYFASGTTQSVKIGMLTILSTSILVHSEKLGKYNFLATPPRI